MHLASVSASLRQGITIDTSTAVEWVVSLRLAERCATDTSLQPNDWRSGQLAEGQPTTPLSPALAPKWARGWRCLNKTNDPDGSPLECWYLPCGLFLLSRTCPSGPSQTVEGPARKRNTESQFAAKRSSVAATYAIPSRSMR